MADEPKKPATRKPPAPRKPATPRKAAPATKAAAAKKPTTRAKKPTARTSTAKPVATRTFGWSAKAIVGGAVAAAAAAGAAVFALRKAKPADPDAALTPETVDAEETPAA